MAGDGGHFSFDIFGFAGLRTMETGEVLSSPAENNGIDVAQDSMVMFDELQTQSSPIDIDFDPMLPHTQELGLTPENPLHRGYDWKSTFQSLRLEPVPSCKGRFCQKKNGVWEFQKDKFVKFTIGKPYSEYLGIALVHRMDGMQGKRITNGESLKTDPIQDQMAFEIKPSEIATAFCEPRTFYFPKYQDTFGFILELEDTSEFDLKFNTYGSDPKNEGNKMENRVWDLIVFPILPNEKNLENLSFDINRQQEIKRLNIQVVAVIRGKRPRKDTEGEEDVDDVTLVREKIKDLLRPFDRDKQKEICEEAINSA